MITLPSGSNPKYYIPILTARPRDIQLSDEQPGLTLVIINYSFALLTFR